MAVPPRGNTAFPIRVFIDIPSNDVLEAVNALVNDVNVYVSKFALGLPSISSTVALLPTGSPEGAEAFATNGRKIGEGSGAGTGVRVYFSAGQWRVISTDAPVLT